VQGFSLDGARGLEPPTSWVRCSAEGTPVDDDGQQRLFLRAFSRMRSPRLTADFPADVPPQFSARAMIARLRSREDHGPRSRRRSSSRPSSSAGLGTGLISSRSESKACSSAQCRRAVGLGEFKGELLAAFGVEQPGGALGEVAVEWRGLGPVEKARGAGDVEGAGFAVATEGGVGPIRGRRRPTLAQGQARGGRGESFVAQKRSSSATTPCTGHNRTT
jgi:hypothetical protein